MSSSTSSVNLPHPCLVGNGRQQESSNLQCTVNAAPTSIPTRDGPALTKFLVRVVSKFEANTRIVVRGVSLHLVNNLTRKRREETIPRRVMRGAGRKDVNRHLTGMSPGRDSNEGSTKRRKTNLNCRRVFSRLWTHTSMKNDHRIFGTVSTSIYALIAPSISSVF